MSNRSSAPKQPRMSLWMMEGSKKVPKQVRRLKGRNKAEVAGFSHHFPSDFDSFDTLFGCISLWHSVQVKKTAEGSDEELHDGGVEVRLEDLRPELRDRGPWSSV